MLRGVVFGVAICACGHSGPSPAADPFKTAECERYVRCGVFGSQADCLASRVPSGNARNEAAVAAGLATWDDATLQACLDAIANESCDQLGADAATTALACVGTAHGTVAGGGTCTESIECISQYCYFASCSEGCCVGTCMGDAPPQIVHAGDQCGPALVCDADTYCKNNTCMDKLGPSKQCMPSLDTCVADYVCGQTEGFPGFLCIHAPPLACVSSSQCPILGTGCSMLGCVMGVEGASCTSDLQCAAPFVCAAGACARLGVGAGCVNRCTEVDTYCDPGTKLCAATKADGTQCAANAECTSGACDPASSTCLSCS